MKSTNNQPIRGSSSHPHQNNNICMIPKALVWSECFVVVCVFLRQNRLIIFLINIKMIEQGASIMTSRQICNSELPQDNELLTVLTGRSGGSSANISPGKPKKNIIRINHKNLPQDFFNFGTSKLYNKQVNIKVNVSPGHSNKPQPEEIKGLWLPNFGEQAFFGQQTLIISDQNDLRRVKSRMGRGVQREKQQCHSPLMPSYRTIGAMTPCPSTGNESPMIDFPSFQWTFSKDMYVSMSPTKQFQEKKQTPLRRGCSVKQKQNTFSFLAQSCEQAPQFLVQRLKRRKSSVGSSRAASQLPRISRRRTPYH